MALLRPSLTLVLDLDERCAGEKTVLEIKRGYAHVGTPVIRTHEGPADAEPSNTMRMLVNLGTYPYLRSEDAGADTRWREVIAPWVGSMLHKLGNNMKVFNDRQRRIGLPEVAFDEATLEFAGGQFIVRLHPQPSGLFDPAVAAAVDEARTLLNGGALDGAVAVEMPAPDAWREQRDGAWEAWIDEHPEALEPAAPVEEPEPEEPKTREQLLEEDRIAKSYENTAVPATGSTTLPRPEREVEPERPEPFDCPLDYRLWAVTFADGVTRLFDSATGTFTD